LTPTCWFPASDDKFVSCALSAGARFLVSGDDDLLALQEVEGVKIVKVSDWFQSHRFTADDADVRG